MSQRGLGAYRRLTALYPHDFREEYRDDLVALFADQLRDEGRARVWMRVARDLAVTVPTRHLEAHMHRPARHTVSISAGIIALAALITAITVGFPPIFLILILVGGIAGFVAISRVEQEQPAQGDGDAPPVWWKFALAGVGLIAVVFAIMAVPWPDSIDIGDNAYWLALFGLMGGLALIVTGALFGVVEWVRRTRVSRA